MKLVPQLSTNLLSVFQIANQGYKVEFYNDKCLVKDVNKNYEVTAIGRVENGLYKFQEFIGNKDVCAIAKYDDVIRLWHERIGHVNYNSLKLMEKFKMVHGLPRISPTKVVCEGCVMGKQHVESFPQGKQWRAKTPLH